MARRIGILLMALIAMVSFLHSGHALMVKKAWGQDKIEAPVWKVGDKWALTSVGIAKCEVRVVDADS